MMAPRPISPAEKDHGLAQKITIVKKVTNPNIKPWPKKRLHFPAKPARKIAMTHWPYVPCAIQTQCMMCIQTNKCVSELICINGYMHNKAFKRPTYASSALLP